MTKALIIASDRKLSFGLKMWMSYQGIPVVVSPTLEEAAKLTSEINFSLIILDIKDQKKNPFLLVQSLREKCIYTPVLYLGFKEFEQILIKECTGLDDFLARPLGLNQLKASINTSLLKSHSNQMPFLYAGIKLNERTRVLMVKDKLVALGRLEMKILSILAKKAGGVVSLETLHSTIEQEGVRFNTRVFYHVANLRRKLEAAGIKALEIQFVKNGYRLDVI